MPDAARQEKPIGRRERRKLDTRIKLLRAASEVMSRVVIDEVKIKDVTEIADVGFGTFYTYFESKDALAAAVLDCMIDDIARRCVAATETVNAADARIIPAVRTRLLLRTAMTDRIWRWWAKRPLLLIERMDIGIGPYAKEDLRADIHAGLSELSEDELDGAWRLALWTMVGGIHDVVQGHQPLENEIIITEAMLRLLGTGAADARAFSTTELPDLPSSSIDWSFSIKST